MSQDGTRRGGQLSSVRNAARLLKAFSREHRELGVTEAARRLGVGTSTAFRLLTTLTEERLLERGDARGTYRLGLAMYELGVTVFPNLGLHEAAMPALAALRQSTGETVQLAVLDHLEVVFVERLESPQTLRFVARAGHRVPAHAASTGKVLLAHLAPDVLRERLRDWRPIALTQYTIASRAALLVDLRRVAERGWAQNIEESSLGAASVAAPIRDEGGTVIAALSVVAPVSRCNAQALRRNRIAAVDAANAISRRIGYRG
ncbi:IclR family transcriptional regulator [Pseudonocardia sp.]|uniref:IclR family transcriptional regulator n=1 Tax=Pseudonocardia sp. TaxID=60912 RepID=UPI003D0E7FAC